MNKRGMNKRSTRACTSDSMRKLVKCKRSQIMNLPFGMIFSIILIIAFIAVAIYVISIFLGLQKCTETGLFKKNLQEEYIDRAWNSPMTSTIFTGNLPLSIQYVCFIDTESEARGKDKEKYNSLLAYEGNMVFYPPKKACQGQRSFEIQHINITKITEDDNPYCIENDGKVKLRIEKGFYDSLVKVS